MTEYTRDEQLRRAAELRAAIVGFLVNAGRPITRQETIDGLRDKIEEMGVSLKSFDNTLYRLVSSGLVTSTESTDSSVRGNVYSANSMMPAPEEKKPKREVAQRTPEKTPSTSAVKIDLVKSTGRVRITFNNYVIEVGVVN